jgi:ABC-type uncharacterized transport system substrate-binding protein
MNRRNVITLLGGMGAVYGAGLGAWAGERPRRIGMLIGMADDQAGRVRIATFKQKLADLGWAEGKNLQIDVRWTRGDLGCLRAYADELIALQPDVLVGSSLPVTATLAQRTKTIPIVFLVVPDPVRNGFVVDQAKPDRNLTGFTNFEFSMGAKWLEVLRQIAPSVSRLGLMFDPSAILHGRRYISSIMEAARPSGLEVENLMVSSADDLEGAIARLGRGPDGGLIVLPDVSMVRHREAIVSLAARYGVPAVYPYRYFATSGGLVSYGIDTVDLYSRAAPYVDRILRGATPADLPIQEPTRFELVINLNVAKALGLEIPPTLLACANEVLA